MIREWFEQTQLFVTISKLRNGRKPNGGNPGNPQNDCSMTDDEAMRVGGDKERTHDNRDLPPSG
jgi:hypothetical protein